MAAPKKPTHNEATVVAFLDNRSPLSINGIGIQVTARTGATKEEVYDTTMELIRGVLLVKDAGNGKAK